jgi:hypothetical protein
LFFVKSDAILDGSKVGFFGAIGEFCPNRIEIDVSIRPKTPFSKLFPLIMLFALPDRSEQHAQKFSQKEAQSNISTNSPTQVMVA